MRMFYPLKPKIKSSLHASPPAGELKECSDRLKTLRKIIAGYGRLLVAFSGGADSSFLLAVAADVLKGNVLAVTGVSPIHQAEEAQKALTFTQRRGITHILQPSREIKSPEFLQNNELRCYFCKKMLLEDLRNIALEKEIPFIAHGANLDDLNDYRPGFMAAEEMGVVSPLVEAGLTKSDIRFLSKELNLETWDKPAQPCLATRIPTGTSISIPMLERIAKAEAILFDMGLTIFRVRHHDEIARIEVSPEDFQLVIDFNHRRIILHEFRKLGYSYVTLDLDGYRQGSMNRGLA